MRGHSIAAGFACTIGVVFALVGADATVAQEPEAAELLRTDSRAPYVHRITLYDHDGTVISPDDEPAMPYSPRATCAKCHPYAQISHGWHFNANDPDVPAGRPGEPWLLVDEQTGRVLAISGRGWPGTYAPQELGLTNWRFVLRFGAQIPGGGFGEPSDEVASGSPEALRWGVSGKLEIDCMFCHSPGQQHDPAEAARQIERENFRWAPTVALGLAVVRGEAGKAPDDWDPLMPPDPDFPERAGPTLIYNKTRFDPDDRVFFHITRRPSPERCYFCHSFRQVGPGSPERWQTDQDVHLAAGLLCVDCHRHGIDHMITRGYEGEVRPTTQPAKASLSCRGCHLGQADVAGIAAALGGRLRAPHPQHRGLPPLHLEKLTCTACHSGPWPETIVKRFQTSLAHGLGLETRDRHDDAPPILHGPIFAPLQDGRIAPQRLLEVSSHLESVRGPAAERSADPVGNSAKTLYLWPLAHDVRPASQALGASACDDCHDDRAPTFFGEVQLSDSRRKMHDFHGYDPVLADIWSLGFVFRPAFEWFGFVCAGLMALLLLRFGWDGFNRGVFGGAVLPQAAPTATSPPQACGLTRFEHVVHGVAILGFLVQAVTGLGSKLLYGANEGWPLVVHMPGAALFTVGLTATALLWAGRCRFADAGAPAASGLNLRQKLMFWIGLLLGFVVVLSMLAAMLPLFGYAEQEALVRIHGYAALLLLIAMAVHTFVSLAARRAKRPG